MPNGIDAIKAIQLGKKDQVRKTPTEQAAFLASNIQVPVGMNYTPGFVDNSNVSCFIQGYGTQGV